MTDVSAAEYALRRGVSHRAVNRAIAEGRIPAKKVKGETRIDAEAADKAWPEMQRGRGGGRPKKKDDAAEGEFNRDEMPDQRANARTAKDVYQARLIKLEFDRQSGKMIDAAEVEQSAFLVARAVRDALLNIPDRVSHMLAGQTDAKAIHRTLTDEIMQVCGDLQAALKQGVITKQ